MGNHHATQRPPVTAAAPASQDVGTLLDELRAELPGDFLLGARLPPRSGPRPSLTDCDPVKVNAVTDLPPRLILGDLDPTRCTFSDAGWSARWQGLEPDTHFLMSYANDTGIYRIEQTWCGVNGGLAMGRHPTPPITMVGQLYQGFPEAWDAQAKQCLERDYQLTYLAHPRDRPNHCYLPDGPFFQVAIPAPAQDLRRWAAGLLAAMASMQLPLPVIAHVHRMFQAVNYVEGKAPAWTRDPVEVFLRSARDTGLAPLGLPVRELAEDSTAAWTLRRELYVIFLTVPFAGLRHVLHELCQPDGLVRPRDQPAIPFSLQPLVISADLALQAESISWWDPAHTTCSFLEMRGHGRPEAESLTDDCYAHWERARTCIDVIETVHTAQARALEAALRECASVN